MKPPAVGDEISELPSCGASRVATTILEEKIGRVRVDAKEETIA